MRIRLDLYLIIITILVMGGASTTSYAGFTTIDVLGNAGMTAAEGINNSGTIVGGYKDTSGYWHGFSYTGGVFTTIDVPGVPTETTPWGINDSGMIVGYYGGTGAPHGFLYIPTPVPEPFTMLFLGVALFGAGAVSRRLERSNERYRV